MLELRPGRKNFSNPVHVLFILVALVLVLAFAGRAIQALFQLACILAVGVAMIFAIGVLYAIEGCRRIGRAAGCLFGHHHHDPVI